MLWIEDAVVINLLLLLGTMLTNTANQAKTAEREKMREKLKKKLVSEIMANVYETSEAEEISEALMKVKEDVLREVVEAYRKDPHSTHALLITQDREIAFRELRHSDSICRHYGNECDYNIEEGEILLGDAVFGVCRKINEYYVDGELIDKRRFRGTRPFCDLMKPIVFVKEMIHAELKNGLTQKESHVSYKLVIYVPKIVIDAKMARKEKLVSEIMANVYKTREATRISEALMKVEEEVLQEVVEDYHKDPHSTCAILITQNRRIKLLM